MSRSILRKANSGAVPCDFAARMTAERRCRASSALSLLAADRGLIRFSGDLASPPDDGLADGVGVSMRHFEIDEIHFLVAPSETMLEGVQQFDRAEGLRSR